MSREPTPAAAVVRISYNDLKDFALKADSSNPQKMALIDSVGRAFGSSSDCLGLIAVDDIPGFVEMRAKMLTMAYDLVNLDKVELEKCEKSDALYSVGWSCGREQLSAGNPDFAKGSYYANPLTDSLIQSLIKREPDRAVYWTEQGNAHPECYADNIWPPKLRFFRQAFMDLGQAMRKTGIMLASVCDAYSRQHGVELQLESTLKKSMNAKGRLLHYFPISEHSREQETETWCAWHNDHGSLTALAPGMYLNKDGNQSENPDPEFSGLFIKARSGKTFRVHLPQTCLAFRLVRHPKFSRAECCAPLHTLFNHLDHYQRTLAENHLRYSWSQNLKSHFPCPQENPWKIVKMKLVYLIQ